jgi:hypothetical protein
MITKIKKTASDQNDYFQKKQKIPTLWGEQSVAARHITRLATRWGLDISDTMTL